MPPPIDKWPEWSAEWRTTLLCESTDSLKLVNPMRPEWTEWHHGVKWNDAAITVLQKNGEHFPLSAVFAIRKHKFVNSNAYKGKFFDNTIWFYKRYQKHVSWTILLPQHFKDMKNNLPSLNLFNII